MNLMQESMEKCRLIEKKRIPDGEGGWIVTWADGAEFDAAVGYDMSMQARKAQQEGVTNVYTVTTPIEIKLEYHDVFKRLSDGKIFRVTSDGDDKHTPPSATFQVSQVSAEEFELTT